MATRLPERPPVLSGLDHIRTLGRGGFADVFLFQQDMPRRMVAVKVLHHDVVDADVLRMFNAEADVMARLSAHPSILTVFDASISADGRPYLVMELCPTSMGARYRSETISVAEVLSTGVKMASALETAIREGVLHRDIKPSNILITTFGTPVLADFGIATSLASAGNDDVIAMSVPWSSPEVVEERSTGTVASEVWALGATLYTLLAGRTPFEVPGAGNNARDQLIARISKGRYTPFDRPDVPARLQQVLARAMDRDPARRQPSMLALATELQLVQQELGLAPTALEVRESGWTGVEGAAALDLSDATVRGPVISTVATNSARKARVRGAGARRPSDDGIIQQRPVRKSRLGLVIGIVAGVVVLLAVAAIVAALVIGGLAS
jgi:serine/threonine protein kinase